MDANDWLRVRREEGGNPSVNYALFAALRREGRLDEWPAGAREPGVRRFARVGDTAPDIGEENPQPGRYCVLWDGENETLCGMTPSKISVVRRGLRFEEPGVGLDSFCWDCYRVRTRDGRQPYTRLWGRDSCPGPNILKRETYER